MEIMLEFLGKELKKDFILFNVLCDNETCSFSVSSVVTFARFSAVSDSTHDDVSNPDANPLNDIVIFLACYLKQIPAVLVYRIFLFYYTLE